jgi:hypothetical protein
LAAQLALLPPSQIHLILNAAYEVPLLLAQVRAFSSLPITDLSFTHLDEENRWGNSGIWCWEQILRPLFQRRAKIFWTLQAATPAALLDRQMPIK